MKSSRATSPDFRQRGSALLAALCFATVLALCLASYLNLCRQTMQLSSRSLHGQRSVQLAEAGLEDALWALNRNDWSEWSISGTTAARTFGGFNFEGGVTASVQLSVSNYNGAAGPRTVTVSASTQAPGEAAIVRTLRSSATRTPLFVNAVAGTTGRVRFQAGGLVDSYDSRLGLYGEQTPGFSGVVSSDAAVNGSAPVELLGVQVRGYVASRGAQFAYDSSAQVIGPATPPGMKIDLSRVSSSPYQPWFDEVVPSGAGGTLPAGGGTIGTAGATAPELYYGGDLVLTGAQTLTVDGPVVIRLTGRLAVSGTAKIVVTPAGSLRIHVAGGVALGGNGIENQAKLPKKLAVISNAASTETQSMATDTPFFGVIYLPRCNFTVQNNQAIHGALVARSVTFAGTPALHYDVALRSTDFDGVDAPFGAGDWREVANGN